MLAVSRFLLGMGKGGGFPAATRAVSEWFRVGERSTAMGIIHAGTAVGGVAAPPLIALLLTYTNWRVIFFFVGALGLLWTIWWWRTYFAPEQRPGEFIAQRNQSAVIQIACSGEARPLRWANLLAVREMRGLAIAKSLSDSAWYFYLFWLPKYLYDARTFDIKGVGVFAWIPYAASGIGCLAGGWFSSRLIEQRFSLNVARKTALGLSAAVMPFILLVPPGIGILGHCPVQRR